MASFFFFYVNLFSKFIMKSHQSSYRLVDVPYNKQGRHRRSRNDTPTGMVKRSYCGTSCFSGAVWAPPFAFWGACKRSRRVS